MSNNYITSSDRSTLHTVSHQGVALCNCHKQIVDLLRNRLDGNEEIGTLFAEPVINEADRSIDWYTDLPGKAKPLSSLSDEERQAVQEAFDTKVATIDKVAKELLESGESSAVVKGNILKKALTCPVGDNIFSLNQKPVLICWGFTDDGLQSVQSADIDRNAKSKLAAAASGPVISRALEDDETGPTQQEDITRKVDKVSSAPMEEPEPAKAAVIREKKREKKKKNTWIVPFLQYLIPLLLLLLLILLLSRCDNLPFLHSSGLSTVLPTTTEQAPPVLPLDKKAEEAPVAAPDTEPAPLAEVPPSPKEDPIAPQEPDAVPAPDKVQIVEPLPVEPATEVLAADKPQENMPAPLPVEVVEPNIPELPVLTTKEEIFTVPANPKDLSFMRGRMRVTTTLVNEADQPVAVHALLESIEPGTNKVRGMAYVANGQQTCKGPIQAEYRQAEDSVLMRTEELQCPNGNHFTPLTMRCKLENAGAQETGEQSCSLVSKSQSLPIKVTIQRLQ